MCHVPVMELMEGQALMSMAERLLILTALMEAQ